jgi:hypothetical protein
MASSKRLIWALVSGASITSAEARWVNRPSITTWWASRSTSAIMGISATDTPSRDIPVSTFRCTGIASLGASFSFSATSSSSSMWFQSQMVGVRS